ncbi:MAG: ABC transporter permease subunit, partial [Deltaproteobacteria bacterium]|nr:ABC transporter permease subunit [Deltaproteobacteria bacterium]
MGVSIRDDSIITAAAPAAVPFWHDAGKRALVFQGVALALVLFLGYYLFSNTQANLARQSIATGFHFLGKEASFEIGESIIPYSAADSYARALLVGALNTFRVSFIGIVLTTLLGTIIGIARLSRNWLVARLAGMFIEVMQNIPVLLQLFFWYAIFYEAFPAPRLALNPWPGLFVCNRGLIMALPAAHPAYPAMAWSLLAVFVGSRFFKLWARRRQERTGLGLPVFR